MTLQVIAANGSHTLRLSRTASTNRFPVTVETSEFLGPTVRFMVGLEHDPRRNATVLVLEFGETFFLALRFFTHSGPM
ncbi:hypothetical protein EL22_27940 [Halostagnicola sp. A56]|nr:hypothetical protein EL22_27940 [Halostagnicola sp. A56]